jgi:hypothetical protein
MKLDDFLTSHVSGNCSFICKGKESQDVKQMTVTISNKPDIGTLRYAALMSVLNFLEQLRH